ncbi:MAG: DUF1080 domain-containing protein [Planctomycetota bacterium]
MVKKFRLMGLAALSLVAGLMVSQLISAHAAEDGWISLFNGKDLTGWKASEKGEFKAEDGMIVVRGKKAHLFTDKEFKNFDFKCEIMTEPGSNSGFYIHTKYMEDWPTQGYEVQVNCSHGDPVRNGSLYNVVKNYVPHAKDNEWYTLEVIVKGKNIVTKVNGTVVVDYTEPEGVTGTRKLGKGSFAIQAHDPKSVVKYRNLMVKELPE